MKKKQRMFSLYTSVLNGSCSGLRINKVKDIELMNFVVKHSYLMMKSLAFRLYPK